MNNNRTLSIRLNEHGLYFSVLPVSGSKGESHYALPTDAKLRAAAVKKIFEIQPELSGEFKAVQILLDTPDTVFVPEEALLKSTPESFLNEAGIFTGADKTSVTSPATHRLCAVMNFDSEVLSYITERFGDKTVWFSPLQENIEVKERVVLKDGGYIVNLTEKNMYVTSFNSKGDLLVAEVLPYQSDADIVYYLSKLTEYSAAEKERIYLYGNNAKQYYKIVRKYFKGVSRL